MKRFLAALVAAQAAAGAAAQTFPHKPLRVVIPVAAGGGSVVRARVIGAPRSQRLGQPGVVESKPGAVRLLDLPRF